MSQPSRKKLATRFLDSKTSTKTARTKTAGEVRFIKDRSTGKDEWAWGGFAPSSREINVANYKYDPKYLKPLMRCLRATVAALGHTSTANQIFTKVKSSHVSPDGNLGGKGYIQSISDMRRAYMNCNEALSQLIDTLYDEVNAPHWASSNSYDPRAREDIQAILEDVDEIRSDPSGWAREEEAEMDAENAVSSKKASPQEEEVEIKKEVKEASLGFQPKPRRRKQASSDLEAKYFGKV